MPRSLSNAAGPMPEICSSFGVLIAPAATMTSRRARHVRRLAGAGYVANADGATTVEQQFRCVGFGTDVQVLASDDRAKEGARRTDAPALVDVALVVTDAALGGCVIVGIERQPEVASPQNEGVAYRMPPVGFGHGQRPLGAPIEWIQGTDPPFRPLEVG